MPSILQKQTTRETDPLTLRGDLANTVIPVALGTTETPIAAGGTTTLSAGEASVGHYIIKVAAVDSGLTLTTLQFTLFNVQQVKHLETGL